MRTAKLPANKTKAASCAAEPASLARLASSCFSVDVWSTAASTAVLNNSVIRRNKGCGNQQQPDGKIEVEDAGEDNQRQVEPAYLAERALMPVGGLESVFGIAVGIDDAFDAGFAFFSDA